ncbi:MAG TPA: hypothetical protein VIO38_07500 [Rariglobus sp.]
MKTAYSLIALFLTLLLGQSARAAQLRWNADSLSLRMEEVKQLPPPPAGVAELKFAELYKLPVGPRGLELTEKVRSLAGKRVRVLGFMVRQAKSAPGLVMLAPYELATNENEYGLSDDLPPAIIFVEVARYEDVSVPFTPGPLLLTGTLEVGRREEADGRFSEIRLRLDEPAPVTPAAASLSSDAAPAASAPLPSVSAGVTTTLPSKS